MIFVRLCGLLHFSSHEFSKELKENNAKNKVNLKEKILQEICMNLY